MRSSLILILLLFSGCTLKDKFVPKKVEVKHLKTESFKELEDYTKKSLTFKELDLKYTKPSLLDDGVRGEWVYYDKDGKKLGKFEKITPNLAKNGTKLLVIDKKRVINLPEVIFSANQKGKIIAIVFNNNAIGIYDLSKNKLTLYKEFSPALSAKYLSALPIFYNDLILFPLLNGNVAVAEGDKFLRVIPVSDGQFNNNIIFLKIVKNSLFIATPKRLILFDPNYLINYDADIKHIVTDGEYLYLFLVDGSIVKLDTNLKVVAKKSLDFADYIAPSFCKGSIYTVANGYLLKISKDLNVSVYSGNSFELSDPIRIDGCKIYNADKVFLIE